MIPNPGPCPKFTLKRYTCKRYYAHCCPIMHYIPFVNILRINSIWDCLASHWTMGTVYQGVVGWARTTTPCLLQGVIWWERRDNFSYKSEQTKDDVNTDSAVAPRNFPPLPHPIGPSALALSPTRCRIQVTMKG